MNKEKSSFTPISSVVRAFDILEYLTYCHEPVGISAISKQFKINRTTTYNLIHTLMEKSYIAKTEGGKYRVTSRMFELGTVYQNSFPLVHLVKRSVFPLQSKVKCTCKLTVLSDNMRAVILFSRCNEEKQFELPLGYAFPLHTSSSGKVLLSFSPDHIKEQFFFQYEFKRYTENTITDPQQFREELEQVYRNGYATDNGEYDPSQVCYAAPVRSNSGAIAAISVSGKKQEMLQYKEQLLQEIKSYTWGLSLELGYNPNPLISNFVPQ